MEKKFKAGKPEYRKNRFGDLLRGSGFALALKIAGIGASYAFTFLITRNLGASVNGLFNLAFAMLTLATVISRAGLDTAMLKFTASFTANDEPGAVKSAYLQAAGLVFSLSLPVSAALFLMPGFLAESLFGKPELESYLRSFALIVFPYAMIMVNSECLRGIRKIKAYLFYEGIGINLFASLFLLVMFLDGPGAEHLAPAFGWSVITLFVASTVGWLRASGMFATRTLKKISTAEMLRTSLPMLASNVLMKMMGWVDTLMLGILRSAEEVGVYNIALKISLLTKLTLTAVNSVIAPQFAAYYSKRDMQSLIATSNYASRLIFWTSAPVLAVLLAFPYHLTGLFGPEFTAGVTALVILGLGQFVASVSGSVGYILNMTGHQVIQQNITLFSITLNVILNFVLIPVWGLTGAAVAASASLAFRNLVSVFYIQRKLHFLTIYNPFGTRKK